MSDSQNKKANKGRHRSQRPRLNANERRDHILGKAADLVRQKGADKVTTRMLAQEASISEALLYQHFPSKDELLRELTDILEAKAPSIQKYFLEATPASRLLVDYLYMTTYLALHPALQKREANLSRLLLESLLGDGSFIRTHVTRRWNNIKEILTESYKAAHEAGHLVTKEQDACDDLNLFFSHQLIIMAHCFWHFPEQPVVTVDLDPEAMIDRVMLFILRGLGFKDAAIKRLYQPEKILARLTKFLRETSLP